MQKEKKKLQAKQTEFRDVNKLLDNLMIWHRQM